MQSFRMSRYERIMVARRNSRLEQVGTTYEFSKFEYVLTVFVDHTSSKCDRVAVKNEIFWVEWGFLIARENILLDSGGEEKVLRCVYKWELNIRYRGSLACRA